MTKEQIKRIQNEIKELTVKLEKAKEKLNNTLKIMEEDASWEMFLEEDTNRVKYYEKHVDRLNKMIDGVA
jgi:hypothetical protein